MKLTFCLVLMSASVAVSSAQTLGDRYSATATQILDAARTDNGAYEKLVYLCDRIGNRLSGSSNLDKAIGWAKAEMMRDGLVNVSSPMVKVPHWVRGPESA